MARSRDQGASPATTDHDELLGPPLRGVIEVEWDGWEDERRPSRAAWIVGAVLLVATVAVGALVVRAVGTDAELADLPDEAADATPVNTETDPDPERADPEPPTPEALAALVPASLDTCVPPAEPPTDGTVQLTCPRATEPSLVTFTLFPDDVSRDRAFDDTVATLGLDPASTGECAVLDAGVHDYVGEDGWGRVACRRVDTRVDLAWTHGGAPVLGTAGGYGDYDEHYRFWSELVERRDGEFPLPAEQRLLDELPPPLRSRCERDLELLEASGGEVAVRCTPATGTAQAASWVRFDDADAMAAWFDGWLFLLADVPVEASSPACAPDGAGATGRLLAPWYGVRPYEQDETTGRLLCTAGGDGRVVLVWTRSGSLIGSVASAPATEDTSMADLLRWWQDGGHRP